MEALLRFVVAAELSGVEGVLAIGQPLRDAPQKPVDPVPHVRRPRIRIPPFRVDPLIPLLELNLPENLFGFQVLGFGKQTLALYNPEILRQLLKLLVIPRNHWDESLDWNRDGLQHILLPDGRHFHSSLEILSLTSLIRSQPFRALIFP